MKHTRIIILLLVLTATFASLNAQTRLRQPEMYFGAHGGVIAPIPLFTPEVQSLFLQRTQPNDIQ